MSPASNTAMERPREPAGRCRVRERLRRALIMLVAIPACGGPTRSTPGLDAPGAGAVDAADPDAAAPDAGHADATSSDAAVDATSPDAAPPCVPPSPNTAPTYTELYTSYFAVETAGHCATDGCHGGTRYNIWLCGPTKDTCYRGMLGARLINLANPVASRIADPTSSPLVWVNPDGGMPRDGTQMFPPGGSEAIARDQIIAWATACALNN